MNKIHHFEYFGLKFFIKLRFLKKHTTFLFLFGIHSHQDLLLVFLFDFHQVLLFFFNNLVCFSNLKFSKLLSVRGN